MKNTSVGIVTMVWAKRARNRE